MLIDVLTVSPFMMNCYVLACEKTQEAIIIDAGDESERILELVKNRGYKLQYLINTHAHVDHISGVAAIQNEAEIPFFLHKKEGMILDGLLDAQRRYNFGDGLLPKVTEFIDPQRTYSFGEQRIKIIETPGHTPGGICLLIESDIFVGDTLFAGSVGRTDLPGGSTETLIDSIKNRLLTLSDELIVHSGHGADTTIGAERNTNPFLI